MKAKYANLISKRFTEIFSKDDHLETYLWTSVYLPAIIRAYKGEKNLILEYTVDEEITEALIQKGYGVFLKDGQTIVDWSAANI